MTDFSRSFCVCL